MRLPFSLFVFCLVLLVGNWSYGKSSKKNHALVNGEGREYSKHNLEPHTYPVKINPRIKTKFFPEKSANHNLYTYASKYDRTASKRRKRDVKTASKKPVCTSEGAFVHPSGCDKFFKCSKAGRKFRMFQFTCEPGTLFNQAKKVCVTVSEAELKLKCQPVAETALKHDVSKVAIDAAAKVQQSKITMKPVIAQNVAEALNAVKVHNVHSTKAPEVHKTDSATAAKVLATSKLTQAHTEQHIDKYFLPHSICTKDGHFVHPNNCTRYYSCRKVGRKFQLFQFDCGATTGAGTIFDEIIGKCVQPGSTNSNCLKTALPEEKVTQESDKVKEKIQEHSVTTSDPTTTTLPPPLEYTTEKIFQSDIVDNAKTHQVSEKVKETLEEGAEGEIKKTITYRNITTIHKLVEIEDYEYAEGSDETGMKTKEIRNFTTAGTRKDVSSKADGETAAKVIATSKLTHAQTKEHADKYFLPRSLCKTEGFFVHPSNCGKYYSCRKVGHRFQLFQFECPAGTIFDDDSDKCMKPESAAAASCLTISTGEIDLHKTITHRNSTTTHILVAGDYEDEESNEQGLSKTRSSRKRTTTATGNEAESNLHKTDSETAAKVLAAGKLTHEHTRQHADKYFLHHSLCKAEGFFVHPSSCGRYYRCRKFGRRFQLFQFECSPGTIFGDDSHSDKCVQPDPTVANCLNVTILETHAGLNATATFRNSSTSHNIVDSDYEYTGSSGERLTKTKASRKSTGSKKMAETEAEAELHSRKATIRNSTTSHTIVDGDYEYTDSSRERLTKTKASQKSAGSRKMAETEAEAGLHSRRATIRNSTTSHTIVGGDYEYTDSSGERLTKTKASRKKSAVATVAEAENHGVGGGLSTAKDISRSAASAVLTNAICKSVGLFPHPSGCHKYYKCDKLGRRFRLFQFDCEPGTFFDEAIGRCDTPQALGETWSCRTGGEEEATVAETFDQIENASKAGRNRRVPVAESGSNKKTTKKTVRKTTSTVVNSAEDYDDDYDEEPHSTTKTTKKTSKSSPSSGSKTVGGGGSTTTRKKTTKKTTTHTVDEGDDEYYDEDEDGDGGSLTKTKSKPSSKSELDASSKNKTHKHIERKSKTGVGESVEDVDVEDSVIGNKKIHRVTSKAVHTEYDDDDYEVEENPKSAKKTKTVKKTTSSHTVLEGEDEYDDSGDADHTVSKTKTARKKVTTSKTTKSEDEDTHGVKDKAKTTAADLLTHRICKAPGLYPHPNGCHKYYKCNSIGKRFTLFQYNCDPGKFFDEVLGHCETREVLGGSWTCKTGDHGKSTDSTEYLLKNTICKEDGFFTHPKTCEKFYRCTKIGHKFQMFQFDCGPGTIFDDTLHTCVHPSSKDPGWLCKVQEATSIAEFDASQEVSTKASEAGDDYEDESAESLTKTKSAPKKSLTSTKTTKTKTSEHEDDYDDEDSGPGITKTHSAPPRKSTSTSNLTKNTESEDNYDDSGESLSKTHAARKSVKKTVKTTKTVTGHHEYEDISDENGEKTTKKKVTVKKTSTTHHILDEYSGEDGREDNDDTGFTKTTKTIKKSKISKTSHTLIDDYSDEDYEDEHGVKKKRTKKVSTTKKTNSTVIDDWDDSKHKASKITKPETTEVPLPKPITTIIPVTKPPTTQIPVAEPAETEITLEPEPTVAKVAEPSDDEISTTPEPDVDPDYDFDKDYDDGSLSKNRRKNKGGNEDEVITTLEPERASTALDAQNIPVDEESTTIATEIESTPPEETVSTTLLADAESGLSDYDEVTQEPQSPTTPEIGDQLPPGQEFPDYGFLPTDEPTTTEVLVLTTEEPDDYDLPDDDSDPLSKNKKPNKSPTGEDVTDTDKKDIAPETATTAEPDDYDLPDDDSDPLTKNKKPNKNPTGEDNTDTDKKDIAPEEIVTTPEPDDYDLPDDDSDPLSKNKKPNKSPTGEDDTDTDKKDIAPEEINTSLAPEPFSTTEGEPDMQDYGELHDETIPTSTRKPLEKQNFVVNIGSDESREVKLTTAASPTDDEDKENHAKEDDTPDTSSEGISTVKQKSPRKDDDDDTYNYSDLPDHPFKKPELSTTAATPSQDNSRDDDDPDSPNVVVKQPQKPVRLNEIKTTPLPNSIEPDDSIELKKLRNPQTRKPDENHNYDDVKPEASARPPVAPTNDKQIKDADNEEFFHDHQIGLLIFLLLCVLLFFILFFCCCLLRNVNYWALIKVRPHNWKYDSIALEKPTAKGTSTVTFVKGGNEISSSATAVVVAQSSNISSIAAAEHSAHSAVAVQNVASSTTTHSSSSHATSTSMITSSVTESHINKNTVNITDINQQQLLIDRNELEQQKTTQRVAELKQQKQQAEILEMKRVQSELKLRREEEERIRIEGQRQDEIGRQEADRLRIENLRKEELRIENQKLEDIRIAAAAAVTQSNVSVNINRSIENTSHVSQSSTTNITSNTTHNINQVSQSVVNQSSQLTDTSHLNKAAASNTSTQIVDINKSSLTMSSKESAARSVSTHGQKSILAFQSAPTPCMDKSTSTDDYLSGLNTSIDVHNSSSMSTNMSQNSSFTSLSHIERRRQLLIEKQRQRDFDHLKDIGDMQEPLHVLSYLDILKQGSPSPCSFKLIPRNEEEEQEEENYNAAQSKMDAIVLPKRECDIELEEFDINQSIAMEETTNSRTTTTTLLTSAQTTSSHVSSTTAVLAKEDDVFNIEMKKPIFFGNQAHANWKGKDDPDYVFYVQNSC